MDTDRILELVPHYLMMLVLVFGALFVLRRTVGDLGFWVELVIVIAIVFVYRPLTVRLGVAPSLWTEQRN